MNDVSLINCIFLINYILDRKVFWDCESMKQHVCNKNLYKKKKEEKDIRLLIYFYYVPISCYQYIYIPVYTYIYIYLFIYLFTIKDQMIE